MRSRMSTSAADGPFRTSTKRAQPIGAKLEMICRPLRQDQARMARERVAVHRVGQSADPQGRCEALGVNLYAHHGEACGFAR